jgi:hypothetical protein
MVIRSNILPIIVCLCLGGATPNIAQDYTDISKRSYSQTDFAIMLRSKIDDRKPVYSEYMNTHIKLTEIALEILTTSNNFKSNGNLENFDTRLAHLRVDFNKAKSEHLSSIRDIDIIDSKLRDLLEGTILVGQDGVFLGIITSKFNTASIFNEFGDYGSTFSKTSIWNISSKYGSRYMNGEYSAYYSYAGKPPLIVKFDEPIAEVTVRTSLSGYLIAPNILRMIFQKDKSAEEYQELCDQMEGIFGEHLD